MAFFPLLRQVVMSGASRDKLNDLPSDFVKQFKPKERDIIVEAFLQTDFRTLGIQAPRPFQLECAVALKTGHDLLCTAGCGAGKTLAMALPVMMLDEGKIALTIVPLKLLQKNHLEAFNKYGIPSFVLNEDTPYDPVIWKALKKGTSAFKNIFCAAEQFFPIHGHIPPLARLLRTPSFTKSVGLFLVDEGHFIATAGQSHGKDPPHRPAYGKLGDVRVQLPASTPCGVFSATLSPPIKSFIRSDLRMRDSNTVEINLCTNRPNIMQAVIPMVGNISNLSNLDLLVPVPYHPPMALLQRGIIFIDHKLSTAKAADYLNDRCPPGLRETKPFRHLHSGMSRDYNDMIYETFKQPDSHIRMVITTAAGAHGLDVPDLTRIILYGVPQTIIDLRQRKGRSGRTPEMNALCLMIAEAWASGSLSAEKLAEHKPGVKEKRTEPAIIHYATCQVCRRKVIMDYSGDKHPDALAFTTDFCCDNHNDGFDLTKYFPGPIAPPPKPPPEKKKRSKYRPMNQRTEVTSQLATWRRIAHSDDPVFRSWPQDWIISDASIILLARAKPGDFTTPNDITKFLHENNDWHDSWADEIHTIISDYDILTNSSKPKGRRRTALASKAIEREDNSLGPESEDEPEVSNEDEVDQEDHNGGGDINDDGPEQFDNPEDEVHTVCRASTLQYESPHDELQHPLTQTYSPVPSRPPTPRRARIATPTESPSSKSLPPRPTKRRKLNDTTHTYTIRRSSRLKKIFV